MGVGCQWCMDADNIARFNELIERDAAVPGFDVIVWRSISASLRRRRVVLDLHAKSFSSLGDCRCYRAESVQTECAPLDVAAHGCVKLPPTLFDTRKGAHGASVSTKDEEHGCISNSLSASCGSVRHDDSMATTGLDIYRVDARTNIADCFHSLGKLPNQIVIEVVCEMVILIAAAHSNHALEPVLLAFPEKVIAIADLVADHSVRCFNFSPCFSRKIYLANEEYARSCGELHDCLEILIWDLKV